MKYKGIRYPLEETPKGVLYNTSDIEQIKSDMLAIILTLPGERVMEPTFGTPLHALNFKQALTLTAQEARRMIASAIKKWEKRIQVDDIKIDFSKNHVDSYDMKIDVYFRDPLVIQKTETLSLETIVGDYIIK